MVMMSETCEMNGREGGRKWIHKLKVFREHPRVSMFHKVAVLGNSFMHLKHAGKEDDSTPWKWYDVSWQ